MRPFQKSYHHVSVREAVVQGARERSTVPFVAQLDLQISGGEPTALVPRQWSFSVSSNRNNVLRGSAVFSITYCKFEKNEAGSLFSSSHSPDILIIGRLKRHHDIDPSSFLFFRTVTYIQAQVVDGQRRIISMLERQIENVCKIKTSKKHYICCIYRMYLCIFFFLYTGGQGQTIPHQQIESSFRIKCFPLLAKVRSSLYPCRVF